MEQLQQWYQQITQIEFWQSLFDSLRLCGPAVPILMACVESFIPALPLVAIVALNVAAYGSVLGFFYSWLGSCIGCTVVFFLFRFLEKKIIYRVGEKHEKVMKARDWVSRFNTKALFILIAFPFTPSAFVNFAFGISKYDKEKYLKILWSAKFVMILLLSLFGQSVKMSVKNPMWLLITIPFILVLYFAGKKIKQKHQL